MMNINEGENDGQNRYVRISILDNDVCMIMKQFENDEVSKCQKMKYILPKAARRFASVWLFQVPREVSTKERYI